MKKWLQTLGTGLVLGTVNAAPAAEPTDAAPGVTTLETIRISATPLDTSALASATPVEVLDGSALLLKRQATLGDTLDGMLGIHADTFGAGASRPVIRGQAAPRVKVLSNGSELMDASAVSPDHAVTAEPMLVERIEVLRGPGALLYGGSAIGGVVNVIDRKVPEALPVDGIDGQVELRGASGSNERTGLFSLTAGAGNVAVHVEGLKLRSGDYPVPDWPDGHLAGSFNRQTSGSAGISWVGEKGYLGVAYSQLDSNYGIPGHTEEHRDCNRSGFQLYCAGHDDHGDEDNEEHDDVPDSRA